MNAVILAGGKGTRLRPLTLNTPKPIVPLMNKPFLSYQIELLEKAGIKDIILTLSYQPHKIEDIFGNGSECKVNIRYSIEDEPLGTGGAVKNSQEYLDDTIVVFNGDVLTNLDLKSVIKYHRQKKAKATIVLTAVEDPTIYGLVETDHDGRIKRFLEKPTWDEVTCYTINAGTYILEREVLDYIPKDTHYSFERELFPALLENGEPFYAYIDQGYWLDIGTLEKYLQAHRDILSKNIILDLNYKKKGENVWVGRNIEVAKDVKLIGPILIGDGSKVGSSTSISEFVVIGNNCVIGEKVFLENCIIGDNTCIKEGSRLKDCIIGKSCEIGVHTLLEQGVVLGDGSIISPFTRSMM